MPAIRIEERGFSERIVCPRKAHVSIANLASVSATFEVRTSALLRHAFETAELGGIRQHASVP